MTGARGAYFRPKRAARSVRNGEGRLSRRGAASNPGYTGYSPRSGAVLTVTTAIRAWVEARKGSKARRAPRKKAKPPWRPQPYGQRVLVFDTETTTDAAQRLLFGFFRLYEHDRLILEGLIVADVLDYEQMTTLAEYAARCQVADLQPRAIRGRDLLSRGLRRRHAVHRLQPPVRPCANRRARGDLPWRKSPQVPDRAHPAAYAGTIYGSNRSRLARR